MSASSLHTGPRDPNLLRDVHFYIDLHGDVFPLIDGVMHRIARNNFFIFGVEVNGFVRPIYDRNGSQVIVRRVDNQNILMTSELKRQYAHHFLWAPQIYERSSRRRNHQEIESDSESSSVVDEPSTPPRRRQRQH